LDLIVLTEKIAVAAAVAASTGIGAYLNAKYHIAKDLRQIYATNRGQRRFERAGTMTKPYSVVNRLWQTNQT
jgi:hypothetical protein